MKLLQITEDALIVMQLCNAILFIVNPHSVSCYDDLF